MAPRAAAKRRADEEASDFTDDDDEVVIEDDSGSEDYGQAKKKKKAATPKKKKAAKHDEDSDGAPASAKKRKPAAKPRAKAPPPPTETTTYPDGWTVRPPSLIYKLDPAAQGGGRVAGFDWDGTLVAVKSAAQFPLDAHDWRWAAPCVPAKLRALAAEGYQLVIFSNQGGVKGALLGAAAAKVRGIMDNAWADLAATGGAPPAQFFFATQKDGFRKPERGMWDLFLEAGNAGAPVDAGASFYCGDAAGRAGDIGDSDRGFAAAAGLAFKTPEEVFGDEYKAGAAAASAPSAAPNGGLAAAFRDLAAAIRKATPDAFMKANAFNKVAAVLEAMPEKVTDAKKQLKGVKGVGPSSLAKAEEWLATGKMAALEELRAALGGGGGAAAPAAPLPAEAAVAVRFL